MLHDRDGFTLIEVLMVVVIMGILATLALPRYGEAREGALRNAVRSDIHHLMKSQEIHRMSHPTYGTLEEMEHYAATAGVSIAVNYVAADGWSAVATHDRLGDFACGVYVGAAPADGGAPATAPEILACGEE